MMKKYHEDENDETMPIGVMTKKHLESNRWYDFENHENFHKNDLVWVQKLIVNQEDLQDLEYFEINCGIRLRIPMLLVLKISPPQIIDSKCHVLIPKSFFLKPWNISGEYEEIASYWHKVGGVLVRGQKKRILWCTSTTC